MLKRALDGGKIEVTMGSHLWTHSLEKSRDESRSKPRVVTG
jgi:hypothetical protein